MTEETQVPRVMVGSILRVDRDGKIKYPKVLNRLLSLDFPMDLKMFFFIEVREFDRETQKVERLQNIAFNRRKIIKAFLGTRADYLLMVDDDQLPPKNIIAELLELKADISAPVTHPKNKPLLPKTSFNFVRTEDFNKVAPDPSYEIPHRQIIQDGEKYTMRYIYFEPPEALKKKIGFVDVVGMFCTLLSRRVCKKIPMRYERGNIVKTGDGQLFDLSEDGLFCLRARERGYSIAENKYLKIPHLT